MLAGRIDLLKQSLALNITLLYPSIMKAIIRHCKTAPSTHDDRDWLSPGRDNRYIDLAGLVADINLITFVPTPAGVQEDIRRDWWLWSTFSDDGGPNPLPAWWTQVDINAPDVCICILYFSMCT